MKNALFAGFSLSLLLLFRGSAPAPDTFDIFYNPLVVPFTDLINWEDETQRQHYDEILENAYDLITYEIRYMDSSGTEISNPSYEKEYLRIIYNTNHDSIIGYIWTLESMKLPLLVYKPKPGFLEDPMIYSELRRYEIIHVFEQDKHISLASFNALSLSSPKRIYLEQIGRPVERYRGLVYKNIHRGYFHAPSTLAMLAFTQNSLKKTLQTWKTQKPNKTIWTYLTDNQKQGYERVAQMTKQDVKKYGKGKWKKLWKKMQKIWPRLKNI